MNSDQHNKRYHRQTILKEFGELGQQKLLNAKVLVIGAGGLGCPALQYLSAAGIGTIGIVDFDTIELTNLQRQILFNTDDIGKSKAETAAKKLNSLNPEIIIQVFNLKVTNANALDIISGFDIVIDGSDNFLTRYLVNDACVLLNKSLIYGAVLRFEGQVSVFNLADRNTQLKTNYRDLFPEASEFSLSCSEAGVLGVLPGIIGTLQATEAIKIITGIGNPLSNKLLTYNAINNSFYDFEISVSDKLNTNYPKTEEAFLNYDYELNCASKNANEIDAKEFDSIRENQSVLIIDVREEDELPSVTEFKHLQLPLSKMKEELKNIKPTNTILVFCNSGQRSLQAVSFLKTHFPTANALSLSGGIVKWKNNIEITLK